MITSAAGDEVEMPGHEPFHFHSLAELGGRIRELGLDLPLDEDVRILLEPVQVGGFTLPNRLVVLPMEGCDGKSDGSPDELTFRRYHRFALGGAGLLWVEATAVVQEGRANPRQLWIHAGTVKEFAALVDQTRKAAATAHGPRRRPMLVLQLTHSGRYSRPGRHPAPIIAHRSPYLDPIHKLPPDYPLISDGELERLEDVYVEAARCAELAGFDGVDVKACHRYLISELHASHTREGRYGGSFENRSRFFRNVVGKIRDRVPGIIVTSRMNAYDAMAYPYGFGVDKEDVNKPDLAEPIELVRVLAGAGAPLVNITIGNPYYNPYVNRPFDLPVAGAPTPPENPLEGVARFVHIVRRIQAEFPQMAVIGGGYSWLRQFFPYQAAANVRSGWVSLAGLGRMSFAYPDFPRDLAERGRLDPEKVCVACSACTQIMRDGGRTGCVPRDAAVYEPIYKAGRAEALDTILEMAKTCRQCNDPTCIGRCPAGVNIPEFVGHIAAGRFREAYETLRRSNVLAAVCGYVCPAETLCEAGCINQHYTESVPIRHLQRWVSRKAVEEGWAAEPRAGGAPSGKRVAVLGAGPAGVAAAATLASLGHAVTLFDAAPAPGGVAGETIPAERLPDAILRTEIDSVLGSSGQVERRYGVRLSSAYTLDHVLAEGFDAALICLGLSRSVPLPKAVRPATGVTSALEFLAAVKRGSKVSGSVLVLGGGNTAIDAALSAKRAGASDVAIVYRRSFAEMPAWPEERDQAIEAGVHFLILTQPVDYVVEDGKLTGVKVVRTRLGAPDASGRRTPAPMAGSEHVLAADLVVEAIGQRLDPEVEQALTGVRLTDSGLVWTQPGTPETSRPGVFAAGDIVNGGTTVVQAVAEGSRAARAADAWLRR
jgi:NADPH-dependent glutamate synthase beta subunit-like oxidoreductase/2,4-dienoyl-CoA reductase-like NADH-dependent reductase (Old Yellow Enzyme family)